MSKLISVSLRATVCLSAQRRKPPLTLTGLRFLSTTSGSDDDERRAVSEVKQPETVGMSISSVFDYLGSVVNSWTLSGAGTSSQNPVDNNAVGVSSKVNTASRSSGPGQKRHVTISKARTTRSELNKKTTALCRQVICADSASSKLLRLTKLVDHLSEFPQSAYTAFMNGILPYLFRLQDAKETDSAIVDMCQKALNLLGYGGTPRGHGVSILCIDGGGTRGVVALEVLAALEDLLEGKKIHEVFDYVVGVSTGAVIAGLLCGKRASARECSSMYLNMAQRLFQQSRVWGTTGLVLSHSYYNTSVWMDILQDSVGDLSLMDSVMHGSSPKVAFVSALVNRPQIAAHLFRNYHPPSGRPSLYEGTVRLKLWQALQASGAAPGYFQECIYGSDVHQDGGIFVNNPSGIALHEYKLLWPDYSIQCLLSLGNGRSLKPSADATASRTVEYSSLQQKIVKIIDSASDTEMTHMILNDLLPTDRYFRLNPYLKEHYSLDESRTEALVSMQEDARLYCRKNEATLQQAAECLLQKRNAIQRGHDWVSRQFAKQSQLGTMLL